MKIKLKYLNTEFLKYSEVLNKNFGNNGKLLNVTYHGESLEFQTPKVLIEKIIKEPDDKEYLLLKLNNNEACRLFYQKISEIESILVNGSNNFESNLSGHSFKVKIPFKYGKPQLNIFSKEDYLFNYYHLVEGMEIILLLSINNIWTIPDGVTNYSLVAKEILIN
jgi:hypothetical protein